MDVTCNMHSLVYKGCPTLAYILTSLHENSLIPNTGKIREYKV